MTNHSRAEDVLFGSSNMIWDALAFRAAHVQISSGNGGPKFIPQTPSQIDGRRERILDVAEKLIRRFGHARTTVADIAWELSLSRATIYRIFPTKEALDAQVCARLVAQTLRQARESLAGGGSPAEQLKRLLIELSHLTLSRVALEPHLHRLFVEAFHRQWGVAGDYLRAVNTLIEETISNVAATHTVRSADARQMSQFVCCAMLVFVHPGLSHLVSRHGGELSVDLATHVEAILDRLF